ncbi:MAG: EamA family transporter [Hydrogenophilales bacterium 17-61-9]|nr:MAG: EamA family transporter [Hydrogenophilales bacterium 17-61-9]
MRRSRVLLTLIALIAFAANSILCRLAFERTDIDAASFTSIRLLSGALTLWLIVALRRAAHGIGGNWSSAFALFAYAAAFSFAYVSLPTGVGALLLFGAVQATMILAGLRAGERLTGQQGTGLVLALGGLGYLMLPGLSAPPLGGSLLMLAAGIAWGVYSLRGRGASDPLGATAGNFLRAAPLGIGLAAVALPWLQVDAAGAGYAVFSGALASGVGYAIWYAALRGLAATHAATVQLAVPVIAAAGGSLLLDEPVTLRLALASTAILGGIALVVLGQSSKPGAEKAM